MFYVVDGRLLDGFLQDVADCTATGLVHRRAGDQAPTPRVHCLLFLLKKGVQDQVKPCHNMLDKTLSTINEGVLSVKV